MSTNVICTFGGVRKIDTVFIEIDENLKTIKKNFKN